MLAWASLKIRIMTIFDQNLKCSGNFLFGPPATALRVSASPSRSASPTHSASPSRSVARCFFLIFGPSSSRRLQLSTAQHTIILFFKDRINISLVNYHNFKMYRVVPKILWQFL